MGCGSKAGGLRAALVGIVALAISAQCPAQESGAESRPVHPGKIVYVDGNTGRVVAEENAKDVPEFMAFVRTPEGRIPVVKVVATTLEDKRWIREYGPDGQLLRSTLQLRDKR
jgi:hypothetical protein